MTDVTTETIKTPFYDFHIAAGAKMVDFAGFKMPIQYKGITAEHLAVRQNVGLFDLSHMGEFEVSGTGALEFLEKTTTNRVATLTPGQIQYSCMPNERGGIVDDLLVYRLDDKYMLVVNAANIQKDFAWLKGHLNGETKLEDKSPGICLLAIQGPNAEKLFSKIVDYEIGTMPYYTSAIATIAGKKILFSRTGYTGEDGFELYIPNALGAAMWQAVAEAGLEFGIEPIGLGARDSLRLEMKMALYGNDIDDTTSPVEAGMSWIVDFDKNFIGRNEIIRQRDEKPKRRLVCLELEGRAFPRHGYDIYDGETAVGKVTSGTFSPSLQKPIALGYVPRELSKAGSAVHVDIRGKRFDALIVKPPFYKKGTHK